MCVVCMRVGMSGPLCVWVHMCVCVYMHLAAQGSHRTSSVCLHLMYWGRITELNPELTDSADLARLTPGLTDSASCAEGLQVSSHAEPVSILGIWTLVLTLSRKCFKHWNICSASDVLFYTVKFGGRSLWSNFIQICCFSRYRNISDCIFNISVIWCKFQFLFYSYSYLETRTISKQIKKESK